MAKEKKAAKELTPEEKLTQALVPAEEQPYRVPGNWCWVSLGAVCKFESGYAFKSDNFSNEYGIPVVRISNIKENEVNVDNCILTLERDIDKKYIIHSGDLLIAMSGATTGKNGVYLSNRTAYLNQRVGNIKVINNNVLNSMYRNYYIKAIEDEILKKSYGGAQPNISSDKICEMPMPLSPLAEQQRIVDRIESLFAKLEEAKEKAQAVVDGFELRRSAILHKAFTGELTRKWRQTHDIELEKWKKTILSELVDGFKYGTSEKSNYTNKGMPVLRIPNIGNGILNFEDMKYLPHNDIDEANQIHENDILIIRSNGSRDLVGKCAIVPTLEKKYAYASFLIRIKPSEKVLADYLVIYLNSAEARTQMFRKAKSSAGIHNINAQELGAITINVPTIMEQQEIVTILDTIFEKEQQAKEAAESVLIQIDIMKKAILARAFRGELGTNNPDEENAEVLLKQIL